MHAWCGMRCRRAVKKEGGVVSRRPSSFLARDDSAAESCIEGAWACAPGKLQFPYMCAVSLRGKDYDYAEKRWCRTCFLDSLPDPKGGRFISSLESMSGSMRSLISPSVRRARPWFPARCLFSKGETFCFRHLRGEKVSFLQKSFANVTYHTMQDLGPTTYSGGSASLQNERVFQRAWHAVGWKWRRQRFNKGILM